MVINIALAGIPVSFNFTKNSQFLKEHFYKRYKNFLIKHNRDKIKIFICVRKDKEFLKDWKLYKPKTFLRSYVIKFKIIEDEKFLKLINYDRHCPLFFLILHKYDNRGLACYWYKPTQRYFDTLIDYFLLRNLLYRLCDGLLIHGCGLSFKEKGLLFMGDSGVGKTTLSKFFNMKDVLCDDKIFIKKIRNRYYMYSYLWHSNNSNKHQGIKRIPLSKIFFIRHGKENIIKKLNQAEALKMFLGNLCFFPIFNNSVGNYELVIKILKTVKCYNLEFVPTKAIKSKLNEIIND